MKSGDLVRPINSCGGQPGSIRCDSAIVISVELSHHESVQVDSQVYHDKEVYECTLMCKCGMFEEYEDNLGMIHEIG